MNYIIFGAGDDGIEVLEQIGKERVSFFADNNPEKVGTQINGIEVISFEKMLGIKDAYIIVLAITYKYAIKEKFEKFGIKNYIDFISKKAWNANDVKSEIINFQRSKMDELLDSYLERDIDPILEFENFQSAVSELRVDLDGEHAFHSYLYNESFLYGHAKAIMEYAGIDISEIPWFPRVCHAAFVAGCKGYKTASIFSSVYDREYHNRRYPYVPAWAVGPYIHYAGSRILENRIQMLKESNKKTVLIFDDHQTEFNYTKYDEKDVINKILSYKDYYDTVIACAYWAEADSEFYRILQKNGIKVMSAGFRFDSNFIINLKTLFDLADDVVAMGYTTAVHYALYLGKPLTAIKIDRTYFLDKDEWKMPVDCRDTDEMGRLVRFIYDKYGDVKKDFSIRDREDFELWFSFGQIKTREEIKTIYQIAKDIFENCDYKLLQYPSAVYKTFLDYQKNYDFDKLQMLSCALGQGFWNL